MRRQETKSNYISVTVAVLLFRPFLDYRRTSVNTNNSSFVINVATVVILEFYSQDTFKRNIQAKIMSKNQSKFYRSNFADLFLYGLNI